MKKIMLISGLALGLFATQAQAQEQRQFGAPFEVTNALAPARLDYLMADKEQLENMQMMGVVSEVCQKEGCWLKLATVPGSEKGVLFVKMKDHAFLLPKDIAGKQAIVQGNVEKKVISVKEQQHYLEDTGASAEEIAKITEPKESYQMEAVGVILSGK